MGEKTNLIMNSRLKLLEQLSHYAPFREKGLKRTGIYELVAGVYGILWVSSPSLPFPYFLGDFRAQVLSMFFMGGMSRSLCNIPRFFVAWAPKYWISQHLINVEKGTANDLTDAAWLANHSCTFNSTESVMKWVEKKERYTFFWLIALSFAETVKWEVDEYAH